MTKRILRWRSGASRDWAPAKNLIDSMAPLGRAFFEYGYRVAVYVGGVPVTVYTMDALPNWIGIESPRRDVVKKMARPR